MRLLSLAPSALLFTYLLPSLATAAIEHGSISVETNFVDTEFDSINLLGNTTEGITIGDSPNTNFGDYVLNLQSDETPPKGVLLTTVAENGRDDKYATAHTDVNGDGDRHFIPVFQAGAANQEINMNVSFAFFPKADWICGLADNSSNNGSLSIDSSHSNLDGGNVTFSDPGGSIGIYTLSGVDHDDGILLVSGAKNEGNFALSRANADSFTIYCHDNNTNAGSEENDPVSFVFIPFDTSSEQIVAMGRISGLSTVNSTTEIPAATGRGNFTVTKGGTGIWHLSIEQHTNLTGTLILSPEGGGEYNVDNIISAEWDAANARWEIQSRDLTSNTLQNTNSTEGVFSFAFIQTSQVLHVDAANTGVSSPDGYSWANAFTDLQDALALASAGDEIWIAEGTYIPGAQRSDSFTLRNGVKIYGGFPTGGGDGSFTARDHNTYTTTLSGDIGVIDTSNDNCYHVVSITDSDSSTVIDGVTISDGYASGLDVLKLHQGGGLYCVDASPTIQYCTFVANYGIYGGALWHSGSAPLALSYCRFFGNTSDQQGGAIYNESELTEINSLTVINSLFSGNSSNTGGAIANASGSVTVINASFSNNSATTSGDALFNEQDQTFTLINSVLWGSVNQIAGTITGNNNLIEVVNSTQDPEFFDPDGDDNILGTVDDDLQVPYHSTVADLGDGTEGNSINTTSTDLAGNPRFDGTIDKGAFEADRTGPVISLIDGPVYLPLNGTFTDPGATAYDVIDGNVSGNVIADTSAINTSVAGIYTVTYTATDTKEIEAMPVDRTVVVGNYVNSTADDGTPGTLRTAIENAVAGSSIALDASLDGQTITLSGNNITISTPITLDASSLSNGLTIDGNQSSRIFKIEATGTVVLNNVTFQNGFSNIDGGAILARDAVQLDLRRCRFLGNTSERSGGAIQYDGNELKITNSLFVGNTAELGGAFECQLAHPNTSSITNCSFVENADEFQATIAIGGVLSLNNCIVWNNKDSNTENTNYSGQVYGAYIGRNNLFEGEAIDHFTVIANTDPTFVRNPDAGDGDWTTVADNDYGDLNLLLGSLAIDAGSDYDSSDEMLNFGTVDLGGYNRVDGIIDLGAYEYEHDIVDPTISLMGDSEILLAYGEPYSEPGINANDDRDESPVVDAVLVGIGEVSNINITPTETTVYVIEYTATDASGNVSTTISRQVTVSSHLVCKTTDSGPGSLRSAIANASFNETITFDPAFLDDATITLTGSDIDISNVITIDASNLPNGITLDGNHQSRIFHCTGGSFVTFIGLNLINGQSEAGGAVYCDASDMGFINCSFLNNQVIGTNGGEGLNGDDAFGGAVYISAPVSNIFVNCVFAGNRAQGGNGGNAGRDGGDEGESYSGTPGTGGNAAGGAIFNNVSISIDLVSCTFYDNQAIPGNGGLDRGTGTPGSAGGSGGGALFHASGSATIVNSIFWNNGDEILGSYSGLLYNLIQGVNEAPDPLFENAANGDFQLQFGSPAIGAGDNSSAVTPIDLDGNPRAVGTIDLGAYESSYSDLSPWAASQGLDASNGAPEDDADGDGRSNLEEFALNGNANDSSDSSKRTEQIRNLFIDEALIPYYLMILPVRDGAAFSGSPLKATIDGITYTIEGSLDLSNFDATVTKLPSTDTDGLPALDSGWSYQSFRLSNDIQTQPKGFLRLRIEEADTAPIEID